MTKIKHSHGHESSPSQLLLVRAEKTDAFLAPEDRVYLTVIEGLPPPAGLEQNCRTCFQTVFTVFHQDSRVKIVKYVLVLCNYIIDFSIFGDKL